VETIRTSGGFTTFPFPLLMGVFNARVIRRQPAYSVEKPVWKIGCFVAD
jgi:hypothetical protein